MRRYGLVGNVMFGFALAALGCAGSRGYQRCTTPRTTYQHYGNSTPTSTAADDYSPPATESQEPQEEMSPTTPEESPKYDPNEIPPPPSFDQGEYLTPPQPGREPLSASNSSGLKRLRVPLKLQPITWRSMMLKEEVPSRESRPSIENRFGHSLQTPHQ